MEIKCPYSAWDTTPIKAAQIIPSFSCQIYNGALLLKKNHNYYYQVQGQLAITGAKWCDFCVYTPHGLSIQRITLDTYLWESVVCKLDDFFFMYMCVVPILSDSNISFTEELLNVH